MTELTNFGEFDAWLQSVSPEFAFLLALPVIIALDALVRDRIFDRRQKNSRSGVRTQSDNHVPGGR